MGCVRVSDCQPHEGQEKIKNKIKWRESQSVHCCSLTHLDTRDHCQHLSVSPRVSVRLHRNSGERTLPPLPMATPHNGVREHHWPRVSCPGVSTAAAQTHVLSSSEWRQVDMLPSEGGFCAQNVQFTVIWFKGVFNTWKLWMWNLECHCGFKSDLQPPL